MAGKRRGSRSGSRNERAQRAPRQRVRIRHRRTSPPMVFESGIAPLLSADEMRLLEARTILGELDRRHPGCFSAATCRTLQHPTPALPIPAAGYEEWRGADFG
jgi:hypothetical protein